MYVRIPKNSNQKAHIEKQAYLLHLPHFPPQRQQLLPDYSALQTIDTFPTLFFIRGFRLRERSPGAPEWHSR